MLAPTSSAAGPLRARARKDGPEATRIKREVNSRSPNATRLGSAWTTGRREGEVTAVPTETEAIGYVYFQRGGRYFEHKSHARVLGH